MRNKRRKRESKMMGRFVPYLISAIALTTLILTTHSTPKTTEAQTATESVTSPAPPLNPTAPDRPQRLTITLQVAEPEDLKLNHYALKVHRFERD